MASILLIDDEPSVSKMIRLALVRAGHRVETAPDGPRGLEAFGDGSAWDLTLVDERMPGLPGRAVIREARTRDPMARLIMVTAHDTTELASEVIRQGATDLLRKPFSADLLRSAVAVALARARAAAPEPGAPGREAPAAPAPAVTHWLNGYHYWPVPMAPDDAALAPHGLAVSRPFHVEGPGGAAAQCLAGLTPHAHQMAVEALHADPGDGASVWDVVCSDGLADYLWDTARMPPALLPIYDLSPRELEVLRAWRSHARADLAA